MPPTPCASSAAGVLAGHIQNAPKLGTSTSCGTEGQTLFMYEVVVGKTETTRQPVGCELFRSVVGWEPARLWTRGWLEALRTWTLFCQWLDGNEAMCSAVQWLSAPFNLWFDRGSSPFVSSATFRLVCNRHMDLCQRHTIVIFLTL